MPRLGAFWPLIAIVLVAACGHRDRDREANSPEGRERDHKAADRKRARHEAKEREREEQRKRHDARAERAAAHEAANPPQPGGTCEGSCQHYLQCKGLAGDPSSQQKCVGMCSKMNLTQQQLGGFERTDCLSAIAIVEGQGSASGGGSKPSSNQCTGCVWDGSSCIWLSQSNWGAGAYSGAYSTCDAACCRR